MPVSDPISNVHEEDGKLIYDVETSVTLDYRTQGWGIERIVLDGISNHLPADCHGSKVEVKLLQNSRWVDLKHADPSAPTQKVVFEDDGRGYTTTKLSKLRSTKLADALSVGQFGEGLKLVAAAALRKGVSLEYRSRNWKAVPFDKPEQDDGEWIKSLCFKITENGHNIDGSRTIFDNPNEDLLREVYMLPQKVLALNDTYRELFVQKDPTNGSVIRFTGYGLNIGGSKYRSRIIDTGKGDPIDHNKRTLFVKGVRIESIDALFDYDLGIDDIAPDRAWAERTKKLDAIESVLKGCTNKEVISTILKKAHEKPESYYDEFNALDQGRKQVQGDGMHKIMYPFIEREESSSMSLIKKIKGGFEYPELPGPLAWVETFKALYEDKEGDKAVIADDDSVVNRDAELMGYKPIKLNWAVGQYLHNLGIQNASEVAKGQKEYKWVEEKDLSLDELEVLAGVREAAKYVPNVGLLDLRVYEGMYLMPFGREVESSKGVFIKEKESGAEYIGLKRSVVREGLAETLKTAVHEMAHQGTDGANDYSRPHAQYGFDIAAQLLYEKVKKPGEEKV